MFPSRIPEFPDDNCIWRLEAFGASSISQGGVPQIQVYLAPVYEEPLVDHALSTPTDSSQGRWLTVGMTLLPALRLGLLIYKRQPLYKVLDDQLTVDVQMYVPNGLSPVPLFRRGVCLLEVCSFGLAQQMLSSLPIWRVAAKCSTTNGQRMPFEEVLFLSETLSTLFYYATSFLSSARFYQEFYNLNGFLDSKRCGCENRIAKIIPQDRVPPEDALYLAWMFFDCAYRTRAWRAGQCFSCHRLGSSPANHFSVVSFPHPGSYRMQVVGLPVTLSTGTSALLVCHIRSSTVRLPFNELHIGDITDNSAFYSPQTLEPGPPTRLVALPFDEIRFDVPAVPNISPNLLPWGLPRFYWSIG